jgi:hypothetical protein
VDLPDVGRQTSDEATVLHCGSTDALGIYELAVILVRARSASRHPAVALSADEFRRQAGAVHTLWRDRAMSQPLSAINLVGLLGD